MYDTYKMPNLALLNQKTKAFLTFHKMQVDEAILAEHSWNSSTDVGER